MTKWSLLTVAVVVAGGSWLRLQGLPETALVVGDSYLRGVSDPVLIIWLTALLGCLGIIVVYECLATLGWWRGGLVAASLYAFSPGLIALSKSTDSTILWSLGVAVFIFISYRTVVKWLPLWRRSDVFQQQLLQIGISSGLGIVFFVVSYHWGNRWIVAGLSPIISIVLGLLMEMLWAHWKQGVIVLTFILSVIMGYLWTKSYAMPPYYMYGHQSELQHLREQLHLTTAPTWEVDRTGAVKPFPLMNSEWPMDSDGQPNWSEPIVFVSQSEVLQSYPGMIVMPLDEYFVYVYFP